MQILSKDVTSRRLLLTGIFAAAILARAWHLPPTSVGSDEVVHAIYSTRFLSTGGFNYTPWLHGPLLYYLSALQGALLGGVSIYAMRVVVAALSLTGLVALWLLRENLGEPGVYVAMAIYAVHPYVAVFGRVYRQDAILATALLWAVACLAIWLRDPSPKYAVGLGTVLGIAVASKELVYVFVPAMAVVGVAVIAWRAWRGGWDATGLPAPMMVLGSIGFAVSAFLVVFVFFYSGWPITLRSIAYAPLEIREAYNYWTMPEALTTSRGTVWYYAWHFSNAPVLAALAVVGLAVVASGRSDLVGYVTAAWLVTAALFLSLKAKQSPRLVTHIAYPAVVLAGLGISRGRGIASVSRVGRTAAVGVVLIGAVTLAGGALGSDPNASVAHTGTEFQPQDYVPNPEAALETAEKLAERRGCDIVLISDVPEEQGKVPIIPQLMADRYIADYNTTSVADLPVEGVVVTARPRPSQEAVSTHHQRGAYHIYAPDHC